MKQLFTQLINKGIRFSLTPDSDLKIQLGRYALDGKEKQDLKNNKQNIVTLLNNSTMACLSSQQERLFFLAKLGYGFQYHVPALIKIEGDLNQKALQKSLNFLIEKHKSLRTNFKEIDGTPVQIIGQAVVCPLVYEDLENLPTIQQDEKVKELTQALFEQSFDLEKDTLMRGLTLKLSANQFILGLCIHHIVTDGWSMRILLKDMIYAYEGYSNGNSVSVTPLEIQYTGYSVWQKQVISGARIASELEYWKNQLTGYQDLDMPLDHPRPAQISGDGSYLRFKVNKEQVLAMSKISKERRMTPFTLFMAAVYLLLRKYSSQKDICMGMPVANRNNRDIEDIVGFFVNTVVMRINPTEDQPLTIDDLLSQVHKVTVDGQDNQNLPIENIIDFLKPERDLSRTPIFQVMINYTPVVAGKTKMGDCTIEPSMDFDSQSSKFDLTFTYNEYEEDGRAEVFIEYSTDLYTANTVTRMYAYLERIIDAFLQPENKRVKDIEFTDAEERQKVVTDWNNTQTDYPKQKCIHQLFVEQALSQPNNTAVVFKDQQLSYAELDQQSTQLAICLQGKGIKPDHLVAICLERALNMIVAVLGILKAGGAYLPIDLNYPDDRIEFMLEDSKAKLLITQSSLEGRLSKISRKLLLLDTQWDLIKLEKAELKVQVQSSHLAYVIYTSGSTGKPKGVMVEHHSVVNHNLAVIKAYGITANDNVLQFSVISFDIFVEEVFPALLSGATLVLLDGEKFTDVAYVKETIHKKQVSLINLPTAYWNTLIDEQFDEQYLKRVIIGGEKAETESYRTWHKNNPTIDVINTYGPTETTVISLLHPIDRKLRADQQIPLGKPLANTQAYILDENLKPLPVGMPGELHTAGAGLARGYLNQPKLTQERFIANPFSDNPTDRLYKTGDLARWLDNGNIGFIGRFDGQVKIRGFRVELGEIEKVLSISQDIRQVVVIAKKFQGNNQLVAYFTTDGGELQTEALAKELGNSLPDYMVPATFIHLDNIPLTEHGKVDRNTLQKKQVKLISSQDYLIPETELEQKIALIWQELLEVNKVGLNDNFFDLGGHSLLVVQLTSQLNKTLDGDGKELNVADVFKHPTIKELVDFMLTGTASNISSPHIISLRQSNPIFVIPGMPGRSDGYYQLADCLKNDGEVFGLQMKGYAEDEAATSLEEMAAHNISIIQQVKQLGKINLYAHSYGGTVVYEMLHQLEQSNLEVGEIVFIDSGVYEQQETISKPSALIFCSFLLTSAGVDAKEAEKEIKQILSDKPYKEWKDQLAKLLNNHTSTIDPIDFIKIWKVTEKALTAPYEFKGKLNHHVKLIIAEDSRGWLKPKAWIKYFDSIEVHYAKGDHLSVVMEPHCSAWIKQLSAQDNYQHSSNKVMNQQRAIDGETPILSIRQLEKQYKDVKAVNSVSFDLKAGRCFGLLGPNGAGKTTTIEMMEGILKPTKGGVYFRGNPIDKRYKSHIGIQFQQTALQEALTVKETLQFFQKLYKRKMPIGEIIEACSLQEYIDRDNSKLSGGQRQRLLLGIALINDPEIIFLDEPTTGLDPQARYNFWELIRSIKKCGKTIILTTHYMDEAEQLCDEIAIMDKGKIVVQDTPENLLKQNFDGILIRLPKENIKDIQDFPFEIIEQEENIEFSTPDVEQAMNQLLKKQVSLEGVQVKSPNLEDLFLKLTGHALRG